MTAQFHAVAITFSLLVVPGCTSNYTHTSQAQTLGGVDTPNEHNATRRSYTFPPNMTVQLTARIYAGKEQRLFVTYTDPTAGPKTINTANQSTTSGRILFDEALSVSGPMEISIYHKNGEWHDSMTAESVPDPNDLYKHWVIHSEDYGGDNDWNDLVVEATWNQPAATTVNDIRTKLMSRGVVDADLHSLSDRTLQQIPRPGIYEGNHSYDVDGTLIWQTGPDGDKCGNNVWLTVKKVEKDSWVRMGTCDSGLDWYRITLVK